MTALRPMSSSAVPNLQGVVALVVDDDADTRDIFAMSLMHAGAEVEVAGSAREALTLVRSRVPDVVVTDISMPGEDGVWLLQQIKGSPKGAQVPVVAVTGHRQMYAPQQMLDAGFHKYMTKPVDPWLLCTAVHEVIADSRR